MTGSKSAPSTSGSTDESPDDAGLSGMAVGVERVEVEETVPGIVKGTRDIEVGEETVATRVIVDVEDSDQLLDTDADRVEVI